MRTRIKICGITSLEDAHAAVHAGADAIGLVFHDASPRHVAVETAHAIAWALPPFVTVVGLFVDAPAERIAAVLDAVPLGLIQFHGAETADDCRRYGRPYIKAIPMRADVDLAHAAAAYPDAAALLVDSHHAAMAGGSGETFDWTRLPASLGRPLVLAGGLTPGNVAQAVAMVRPYAVDVSSGVEKRRGVKDTDKMAAFVRAVVE